MDKRILTFILVFLLCITLPIFACEFDTDCDVGSVCLKQGGQIYGVCIGGLSPGNQNDEQPVYDENDPDSGYGNQCQFDTDCDVGQSCAKQSSSIYGTCM